MYFYDTFVLLIPGIGDFLCIPVTYMHMHTSYVLTQVHLFLHCFSYKNRRKLGLTNEAGHKKGDYFGKGNATTRLCVDLATASGMDNAARCTAHGRRKSMISSLVNSSVALPTKIILDNSRHGSAEKINK